MPALASNPDKTALRSRLRAIRAGIPAHERDQGAAAISAWSPLHPQASISAYLAIGDELDPAPLLVKLEAQGHRLCLPVMTGRDQPLSFRAYAPGDALATVQWGIREPVTGKPELEPDILLVPLLAVDAAGYRLGYGGGYYDRTLRALRARQPIRAIGLAFDAQIIDAVPHLDYDERIDAVLTPTGYRALR